MGRAGWRRAFGRLAGASRARVIAIAALLVLCTCSAFDRFEITERATTTIPRATLIEQLTADLGFGGLLAVDITESETLRNRGVQRHQLRSVTVGKIELEISDPREGADFTFLEELEFYAEAEGLPRTRIARGGPFPPGQARVELELDAAELVDYATAPSMDITTTARGRRPAQETTIAANVVLLVDVDLGGALCGD